MVSDLHNIYLPNDAFLQPTSKLVCSAKTHNRLGGQGKSSGKCFAWGAKFKPVLTCTQDNRAVPGADIRLGVAHGACWWSNCSGLGLDFSYLFLISQVIGISLLAQLQWLLARWKAYWVGWLTMGSVRLSEIKWQHVVIWFNELSSHTHFIS